VNGSSTTDLVLWAKNVNRSLIFGILSLLFIAGTSLSAVEVEEVDAASFLAQQTLILFDAATGTPPAAPLMEFTDFPPGAAMIDFSEGAVLDTTSAGNETYAGWVSSGAATPGFPILDRAAGFRVNFTLQLDEESHTNPNRAGFSVIVQSHDARGVELGFWQNQVWAQGDESTGGLFQHAEGVVFSTAELTEYQIAVAGDTYTLTANAIPVLTGPVRDYSAFNGFPDPYESPDFLFLGDDTTSAQARLRLRFVSVTGEAPVASTAAATASAGSPAPPSPTSLPSLTPLPSTTPPAPASYVCPPGLLFLILGIAIASLAQKLR
jgi:hypothetical protein